MEFNPNNSSYLDLSDQQQTYSLITNREPSINQISYDIIPKSQAITYSSTLELSNESKYPEGFPEPSPGIIREFEPDRSKRKQDILDSRATLLKNIGEFLTARGLQIKLFGDEIDRLILGSKDFTQQVELISAEIKAKANGTYKTELSDETKSELSSSDLQAMIESLPLSENGIVLDLGLEQELIDKVKNKIEKSPLEILLDKYNDLLGLSKVAKLKIEDVIAASSNKQAHASLIGKIVDLIKTQADLNFDEALKTLLILHRALRHFSSSPSPEGFDDMDSPARVHLLNLTFDQQEHFKKLIFTN